MASGTFSKISPRGSGLNASQMVCSKRRIEDLLDRTLRQVAAERHRQAPSLCGIPGRCHREPGEPYHEQLRFLRTVDEL
jgi:hypothetical protein